MPFLAPLIPIIASIGSLAGTGIGLASSLGAFNPSQPQSPGPPTAAQNVADEIAKRRQQGTLVANADPNIVSATSGSLSGLSDQTFASQQAGLPGVFGQGGIDLNSILSFLGGSGGGSPTNLYSLASTGAIA